MEMLFAIVLRRTKTPRSRIIAKRIFCEMEGGWESIVSSDEGIVVPFFES
jgi:hypothetical protein